MKFVSILLVAMIAMMLVVPALGSECTLNGKPCGKTDTCCGADVCGYLHRQGYYCMAKSYAGYGLVRKSLLSALNMLEDN